MFKDSFVFMDKNGIIVHFRDVNGKRFHKVWQNVTEFQSFNWDEYDDEFEDDFFVDDEIILDDTIVVEDEVDLNNNEEQIFVE